MFVKLLFVVPVERPRFVVFRAVLDGITRQINRDFGVGPAHAPNPFRGDQHFLSRPPITGIDDHVTDRPRLIVNQKVFHVTDIAVRGFNVIVADFMGAAQMDVALFL